MTRANQARTAAYRVVRAVLGGDDLPRALAGLRDPLADDRDRALVTELSVGTFRWLGALDHVVGRAADRPVARIDDDVLTVLRLGAYQLLHLDRVPPAAAVDESVRLARRIGKSSAAGFVNAVLRRIAATREEPGLPPPPGEAGSREARLAYLSVTGSHPRWLVERWLDRHGLPAVADWVRFNKRRAPPDPARQPPSHHAGGARAAARGARRADRADPVRARRAHRRGREPLSDPRRGPGALPRPGRGQSARGRAGGRPPRRARAGRVRRPGGKITAIAGAMGRAGLLVAGDLRPARLRLLRGTLAGMGADAAVVRLDMRRGAPFGPVFDRVLVDAPCSGLGVLRRDPEIRWRRRPGDLPRFAAEQLSMVGHAAGAVRPGGVLVYATCSSEPDENEEVAAAFLDAHPEFEAVSPDRTGPVTPGLQAALDDRGRLSTTPFVHGLDAFFAIVLRRRGRPATERRLPGDTGRPRESAPLHGTDSRRVHAPVGGPDGRLRAGGAEDGDGRARRSAVPGTPGTPGATRTPRGEGPGRAGP